MIQLSRLLVRQLRAVLRKLATRSTASTALISFSTGMNGLHVRLHRTEIQAEYHEVGDFDSAEIVLPLQALAENEGKTGALVTFVEEAGQVHARWEDDGIPREVRYDREETPPFPAIPDALSPVDTSLLAILADASLCVSQDNIRYATTHIQLKGSTGHIVAADGRQLLQTRFPLPFREDVLIPASSIFACKEFQSGESISIGKTATQVTIQRGAWTLHLPIDTNGRYPQLENVIPKVAEAATSCSFDAADRDFLVKALSRLPGADDDYRPVTVDLNGQVCLRAKSAGQEQTVDLVLSRSTSTGKAVRFAVDRNYFGRAVQLGLSDLYVQEASKPLLFQNGQRQFVVMPLTEAKPLPPCEKAVRIASLKDDQPTETPQRRIKNVEESKTTSNSNGHANGNGKGHFGRPRKIKNTGFTALIDEADALKHAMRELCSRSHKLVVGLKRHRKQTRLVQSSLKALKELQHIDA